ncbi:hypothetical protein [Paraburkholderia dipogonis]|uniref:hypothetical protein n=1 Tax=Paraburkholderia dipogonis TaxID=1211383 RepID=UPI0038B93D52
MQTGTLHVTADNAAGTLPRSASTDDSARVPMQSVEGHIAPAPEPSTQHAAEVPRQEAQPHPQTPQTPQTPALAAAPAPADSKAAAVQQTGHGRDGLHRRDSSSVSSAATDELVKESAKLDPALPPPEPFVHDDQPHRSSNAVAAAMTQQLVKESAKLDPALPPPNPSGMH